MTVPQPPSPSRALPVWVVVLIVVIMTPLVLGGALVGWYWEEIFAGSSPQQQSSTQDKIDDDIKRSFDLDNASFYTVDEHSVPDQKVTLTDGKHYPSGSGEDPHTEVASEPVYSDMDGDGDLDASAVLAWKDREVDASWADVFVWLWEDGKAKPLKWSAVWQLGCIDGDLKVSGSESEPGIEVRRAAHNVCDAGGDTETVKIVVKDGVTVREYDDGRLGATEACWKSDPDESLYADLTGAQPRLAPVKDAPRTDMAGVSKVEAYLTEDWNPKMFGGFALVNITADDGTQSCGWLPSADVEPKLS